MKLLGQIGKRKIYYCNVRSDESWFDKICFDNWIAFTIVDENDRQLLKDMTAHCLDKGVCYTCSSGQLASLTEDYFDEEIVDREIERSAKKGKPEDYESTPMTSFHKNFDEGFWFAATTANQTVNDIYTISNEVVCIDCTKERKLGHLINLVDKINDGWLPPDDEIEKSVS